MHHASPSRNPGRAFTLIEVLMAVVIGMIVMGLAVSAYTHSQRLIRRAEAFLRLHRQAGDIAECWEQDINALLQHAACNSTTTYVSGHKDLVQFTGMRSLSSTYENMLYDTPNDTDLTWLRWEWHAADHRLVRGQSPSPHWLPWFKQNQLSFLDYGGTNAGVPMKPVFGMRPNLVRTYDEFTSGQKKWYNPLSTNPSVEANTRIYDLLFLTGTDHDGSSHTYGGFAAEMNPNAAMNTVNPWLSGQIPATTWATLPVPDPRRTLSEDVTDCAITVITRSGTIHADSGTGFSQSIDGETQDGLSSADRAARPSVLRLSLTLTDRATGLIQSFTFSAKAP